METFQRTLLVTIIVNSQVSGYILFGNSLTLGIALFRVPGSFQSRCGVVEIFSHSTDVVILQIGNLVNLTRLTLTEEHILQTVIAQNARVGGFDEVVEVRHRFLITQHIGQVVGGYRPCVGVGIDRVDIGSTEEEGLGVLPIGTGGLPISTSLIEGCLRAIHYGVVCIVIA